MPADRPLLPVTPPLCVAAPGGKTTEVFYVLRNSSTRKQAQNPEGTQAARWRAARRPILMALAVLLAAVGAQARPQDDRVAELERQLAELKARIEALEEGVELRAEATETEAVETEAAELARRLDLLAAELERLKLGEAAAQADESERGLGPAASKIYRTGQGLSIGGYGEMLYQGFDSSRDDGAPSGRSSELDFLRAIVYFGYKFNDRWLFNSEIEVEHASSGEEGETSVEFAYIDYLWRPQINVRAGLVLVPMGFVNELHEPTVFLGAKRPDVERVILPTTWRENGFGLYGDVGPFSYRTYVVNGFEAAGFSSGGLRGGRQKGSEALAEDFAWVGRLDYTGTPGLLLGASAYVGDSGQDLTDPAGRTLGVRTEILEAHAEWKWRGLELRALGVRAEISEAAALNRALGLSGARSVGEELEGYYLQAGYDVLAHRGGQAALIPYARFESYDTQAAVPAGFARDPARDVESLTLGVAFKPLEQLVIKADVQDYDNGAGTGVDEIHVALGYIF